MEDGGSAVLHWWRDEKPEKSFPVALVVHGMTSGSDAASVQYLVRRLEENCFVAATVNMRGHGEDGSAGGKPYAYRMDDDLRRVFEHVRMTRRPPFLCAIGLSVGANQLVCFLGNGGCSLVDAAASVSNPFDMEAVRLHFRKGIPRLVGAGFARFLQRRLREREGEGPSPFLSASQIRDALECSDIEAFDTIAQVPIHGARDVEEFYRWCSSLHSLPGVTIPLLLIHAKNDPLIPLHAFEAALKAAESNPNVMVVATEGGGHLGWSAGNLFSGPSWADDVCSAFLEEALEREEKRKRKDAADTS